MENISAKIYNVSGKDAGTANLPSTIWDLPWNADLVHQVVTGMQSNARTGTANTKGRGEVSGGGKKPWQQKGTGRARHGSSRSPIWRKGGITHGPSVDKNYDKKINKKMRIKALFIALSQKLRDGKVLFVDSMEMSAIKTKDAQKALVGLEKIGGFETINTSKANNIFLIVPKSSATISKSFRNIPHVSIEEARNINPMDVMNYRYIVIANPADTNEILSAKLADKKSVTKVKAEKPIKKSIVKKEAKKVAAKKTASAKKAK